MTRLPCTVVVHADICHGPADTRGVLWADRGQRTARGVEPAVTLLLPRLMALILTMFSSRHMPVMVLAHPRHLACLCAAAWHCSQEAYCIAGLQANDSDLKNELAKLVGSDAWDAARLVASANAKVCAFQT
jgi:hypothetical protein